MDIYTNDEAVLYHTEDGRWIGFARNVSNYPEIHKAENDGWMSKERLDLFPGNAHDLEDAQRRFEEPLVLVTE